jgi:hypothetical protein
MTNVASSLLALVFPYGTGVSLYWLLTVRRIEVRGDDGDSAARTARQTKPPLARFSWLLLVSSAISFALAWVYSALIPSDDPGLLVTKRYAEAVHAYVALFGLAAALLRTTRSPAAIPASDAISAMSLLVFPLGPVLTIYWFCWVRRSEVAS